MLIKVGNFEYTEVWDGVFYKKLSGYPKISDYEELIKHPNVIFDGVLPMKVKDEFILSDWVYRIVIPAGIKGDIGDSIPYYLKDKVIYVENDCKDIWDWSEKVYCIIEGKEF